MGSTRANVSSDVSDSLSFDDGIASLRLPNSNFDELRNLARDDLVHQHVDSMEQSNTTMVNWMNNFSDWSHSMFNALLQHNSRHHDRLADLCTTSMQAVESVTFFFFCFGCLF